MATREEQIELLLVQLESILNKHRMEISRIKSHIAKLRDELKQIQPAANNAPP